MRARAAALPIAAVLISVATIACGTGDTVMIGAVYPQSGTQVAGADELDGLLIAADLTNAAGGVNGKRVAVSSVDAGDPGHAVAAVDRLVGSGARVIFGTYASSEALPASQEASRLGAVFVETGSLSDTLTGRGLPGVLRTCPTGSMLGRDAVRFVRDVVLPHEHVAASAARLDVLDENDSYGTSVADGAIAEAAAEGLIVADTVTYALYSADYTQLAARVAADHPTALITGQYALDAIPFRRALAAQHAALGAVIGASSAYSSPATGASLGAQAVGLFAADRTGPALNPSALSPATRSLLAQARSAYGARFERPFTAEAMTGFVGGWIMLHDVLPGAASFSQADVTAAADALDLPAGSEIDGSGVRFAASGDDVGQNLRAADAVWEWVGVGQEVPVYPPNLATLTPRLLALQ